jgi:hypothetical protein
LHDEEWRQDRDDPEGDGGNQRRILKPFVVYQCNEDDGERGTNQVVGDPSYRAFSALLQTRCNIRMSESSFWHVSKPAPDDTDVGRSNLEGMFEKLRPKIKSQSCAKPDEDCADEGKSQIIDESPFC